MPHRPAITSPQNAWIKELARLQQSSARREQGRFLVEGTHLLQEALATQWPLGAICFTPSWAAKNNTLLPSATSAIVLQEVSDQVLARIATTETPDGVVAIGLAQPEKKRELGLLGTLSIAAERLQDPGNLGTLIRFAAATEADGLYISPDSVEPTNPKVLRTSAGQWFRRPPMIAELPELIDRCNRQSIQILGAAAHGESMWTIDLTIPTLIIMGNEGRGLSPELQRRISKTISIPMAANVESLNLAMSAGVLLYEARRQRSCVAPRNT
jgi:RNA methyltransferase, TrmH family